MGPAPSPSISRSGLTAQRPKGEVAPPEPGANSWQLGPKPFLSVVTSTGLQATRRTSQLRKHWLQAFPEPPTPPLHRGQLSPAGEALSAVWESKVNLCSFVSARLTSGRYFRDTQGSLGPSRLRVPGMLSDGGRGGVANAPSASRPHSVNVGPVIQRAPSRSSVTSEARAVN